MDEQAGAYEDDGHEVNTYSREWAEEYAARHWTAIRPMEPGGFIGAFPGREWACRVAEQRGHWAVLQLDDNIKRLGYLNDYSPAHRLVKNHGGLGLFADILTAVTLSTNGFMTGARMSGVPADKKLSVARPGFPYSLFLERVDAEREAWYGPYEDDIMHAYQYAYNATPAAALLVNALTYCKESRSRTGMRTHYDHDRSVALQRIFPETARIGIHRTRSNGAGAPRVFHTMLPGALGKRAPLIVTDRELFAAVKTYLDELSREWYTAMSVHVREKVISRAVNAVGLSSPLRGRDELRADEPCQARGLIVIAEPFTQRRGPPLARQFRDAPACVTDRAAFGAGAPDHRMTGRVDNWVVHA